MCWVKKPQQPSANVFQVYCIIQVREMHWNGAKLSVCQQYNYKTKDKRCANYMFPDSGSWSFKDKTQTANDSAGQASCQHTRAGFP